MSQHIGLASRLAYNQIDAATGDILRRHKTFIMAELPGILDKFYDHVSQYRETASFFGSREHMNRAKDAQIRHWGIIMDGRFDTDYETSIRRIGETHHRIKLDPRWYIGGYNALISGLMRIVATKLNTTLPGDAKGYFSKATVQPVDEVTELQIAISRAALLDMDLAISSYFDAGRQDLQALSKTVLEMTNVVATTVQKVQTGANDLTRTAKRSLDQTATVAAAAEQASSNVRTVAAAADELTASVKEIGRQVSNSSETAERAVTTANSVSKRVQELSIASNQIGTVVDLISNIARQTNLLALNATIEAARAGEAGKGFAVVAQEVKSLASQTSRATAEIIGQINAIQGATSDAVMSIQEISRIIGTINSITSAIAASVEEQGSATVDIARNIQEASHGTSEVATNTSGLSTAASDTETAAKLMSGAANDLATKADELRKIAESFMEKSRAA